MIARRSTLTRLVRGLTAGVLAALLIGGCVPAGPAAHPGPQVVAAENFWGSIAAQVGGTHVNVTSIIANPNTDPHDYEPTVADGRALATSRLVIVNGVGYDPWAQRLLAANPDPRRIVLDVGRLAGVAAGGNPHQWYSPSVVHAVIAKLAADLAAADPANAADYAAQGRAVDTVAFARYDALVAAIRSK